MPKGDISVVTSDKNRIKKTFFDLIGKKFLCRTLLIAMMVEMNDVSAPMDHIPSGMSRACGKSWTW
jgi:hypothetical protein